MKNFRIWDSVLKKMIYPSIGNKYKINLFGNVIYMDSFVNDAVVMASTGLKDKNGKEIFEGDVLKHWDEIIIVEYENDFAGFNICYKLNRYTLIPENIEVIGNIYENPELLELFGTN